MKLAWRVAKFLADGRHYSIGDIAEGLDVSRLVVNRAARALDDAGLDVHYEEGKSLQLRDPVEWLDSDLILAEIGAPAQAIMESFDVVEEVSSTNERLISRGPPEAGKVTVCLSEYQSGGRGRRGRKWQSPPGAGIYLSLGWLFESQPQQLAALGLVAGLTMRQTLLDAGASDIMLKWPNDLTCNDDKLGGVLSELRSDGNGPAFVVLGVGVNFRLPKRTRDGIIKAGGLVPTDLAEVFGSEAPGRNQIAGKLTGDLIETLQRFDSDGFAPWQADWAEADCLIDRFVRVSGWGGNFSGTAKGIDEDGALRIDVRGEMRSVVAGDVTVRPE
ncbi:MAG: biotin--[acetyl-CoA-carboxylase] ligase [Gammaproteobacteria bacterium]